MYAILSCFCFATVNRVGIRPIYHTIEVSGFETAVLFRPTDVCHVFIIKPCVIVVSISYVLISYVADPKWFGEIFKKDFLYYCKSYVVIRNKSMRLPRNDLRILCVKYMILYYCFLEIAVM